MVLEITSTTDSPEAVNAAKGILAEKTLADKSAPAKSDKTDDKGETTEASETTDTDLEETQDAESTSNEDADDGDADTEKEADEKPKKQGGFQKRIARFQKQLSQKDQELAYWKQEALTGKAPAKTDQKTIETKAEPIGKPKADKFKTHEDYVEALTDWKIEQREKSNEQKKNEAQVKTEFQKKGETFQARISEFKKTNDDFDDLMADTNVDVPVYVQEIFLTSEIGPALMYELAKNPKELARISKLSPIPAALEMGKLEAKLSGTSTKAESKETKITKAPEPIKTVGAKGGSLKKSIDDPNLSQREFEKLRNEQLKAKRAQAF